MHPRHAALGRDSRPGSQHLHESVTCGRVVGQGDQAPLAGSQGRGLASSLLQKLRAGVLGSSAAAQPSSSMAVVWAHHVPHGTGDRGSGGPPSAVLRVRNHLVLTQRLPPPAWSSHGAVESQGPACPPVKPPLLSSVSVAPSLTDATKKLSTNKI